ncbi:MAG TPA: hypothetical protein VKB71_10240 [Rhizomicrobium sp.]|nr:hypothetical protein [Rhizomicrobium sp.]
MPLIPAMPRAYAGQLIKTPQISSVEVIHPRDFASYVNASVYAVWKKFAGDYDDVPSRDAMLPKPVAPFMSHISLMRWAPEYDDYEIRFMGDAHVQAHGLTYKPGIHLSAACGATPQYGRALKRSNDQARTHRAPVAMRGLLNEAPDARSVRFEAGYLPLRGEGEDVEFVLNVAVYQLREGAWPN